MKTRFKTIVTTGVIAISSGCHEELTSFQIDVKAKTADGRPVPGATIEIDDQEVGQTNAFGTFSATTDLKSEQRHKISITKNDPNYYYAPHFEFLKFDSGQSRQISLNPTMYTVPKPKDKSKNKQLLASHEELQNPPKNQTRINTEQTDPIQITPPMIQLRPSDFNVTKVRAKHETKSNFLFTIHIYGGRIPIENASVTWLENGRQDITCITNIRGRCVIKTTEPLEKSGYLLIQRAGYKSQLSRLMPRNNDNFWYALDIGSSIDIRSQEVTPWSNRPLSGVSITLKNNPEIVTNEAGIAIINVTTNFPITFDIRNPNNHISRQLTIKNPNDTRIPLNFASTSYTGWKEWRRYPVYLDKDQVAALSLINFAQVERELIRVLKAAPADSAPNDFKNLPDGTLAFLPVLNQHGQLPEVAIAAISNEGIQAQSKRHPVSSHTQSDSWAKAIDTSFEDLLKQLPWTGSISDINKNDVTIAINTAYIRPKDPLTIKSALGDIPASIVRVSANTAIAKLDDRQVSSIEKPWLLMGATVVKKSMTNQVEAPVNDFRFNHLLLAENDHASIRLAKKYLAEGNVDLALKSLDTPSDSPKDAALIQEMKAKIEVTRQNKSEVIKALHKILSISAREGFVLALRITEANLVFTQVESTPAISGDSETADYFRELKHQADLLLKEIPVGRLDPALMTTLRYSKILALQKEAESRNDLITLATMNGTWEDFERDLAMVESNLPEVESWKRFAKNNKSKVAITSSSDKTSM